MQVEDSPERVTDQNVARTIVVEALGGGRKPFSFISGLEQQDGERTVSQRALKQRGKADTSVLQSLESAAFSKGASVKCKAEVPAEGAERSETSTFIVASARVCDWSSSNCPSGDTLVAFREPPEASEVRRARSRRSSVNRSWVPAPALVVSKIPGRDKDSARAD